MQTQPGEKYLTTLQLLTDIPQQSFTEYRARDKHILETINTASEKRVTATPTEIETTGNF